MATNIKNIYGIETNDCKITGDIIVTDGTLPILSNSSKIGKKEEKYPIIEIDASLEYRDGEVYIKRLNTNEMPAILSYNIISALTKTIEEYYLKGKQDNPKEED